MRKEEAFLFLKNLKGVGNTKINKKYVSVLKTETSKEDLIKMVLDNEKVTETEVNAAYDEAVKQYSVILDNGIGIITVIDERYPRKLDVMGDSKPVLLYYKGNVSLLNSKAISVVGTRTPSDESIKAEMGMIKKIKEASDVTIVSGLAYGCDRVAHESALKYDAKTVAVLPSGINNITPKNNEKLASEILEKDGCLISEYAPEIAASKYTFVERDKIIAAISDATVVIECAEKSGTMHTADAAVKYLRKIACYMPNQLTDKYDGNQMIVKEKGGDSLSTETDLLKFLDKISKKIEENPVQMTLFDLT